MESQPIPPEFLAIFEKDAQALLARIETHLKDLLAEPGNAELIVPLRNDFHGLRGAASLVGVRAVQLLAGDLERLLEVAHSFVASAPERAQSVYQLIGELVPELRKTAEDAVRGQPAAADEQSEKARGRIRSEWGSYFYEEKTEEDEPAEATSFPQATPKSASTDKPASLPAKEDRAKNFLASMGVAPAAPAAQSTPARSSSPSKAPSAPARKSSAGRSAPPSKTLAPAPEKEMPLDREMLSYFVLETSESLEKMEEQLLVWEANVGNNSALYTIYRLVHTIKGAANSLGMPHIGPLLHRLEDVLERCQEQPVGSHHKELVAVIYETVSAVRRVTKEVQHGSVSSETEKSLVSLGHRVNALHEAIPAAAAAAPASAAPKPAAQPLEVSVPAAPTAEVVPISTQEAETAPAVAAEESAKPSEKMDRGDTLDSQTIRVESHRLDLLMNLVGELVINRTRLERKLADIARLKEELFSCNNRLMQAISDFQGKFEYSRSRQSRSRTGGVDVPRVILPPSRGGGQGTGAQGFSDLELDQYDDFNILARSLVEIGTDTSEIFSQFTHFIESFTDETGQFSKITGRMQDEITRTRMIPLTGLFRRLQRVARDASLKENKPISFETSGSDSRLDKIIADQVYTPLLHIVRNAVSHGIESESERAEAGKARSGQVALRAYYESNQAVIEIEDDGRGLNFESIRETAVRRGLLRPDAQVDNDTLTSLIFEPGFSTAAATSSVSGRGVGLDVVRREIARLNGSIQVISTPGSGCTFVIRLPLTLAINQAMLISVHGETFALPLNFIERIVEATPQILTHSGPQELARIEDEVIPVVRLHQLLELPGEKGTAGSIVVARVAERRLAILVDRILHKQDIVVKPLGPLLLEHALFSGATLSGEGRVVLIFDVPGLAQTVHGQAQAQDRLAPGRDAEARADEAGDFRLLVVDDSLSVRKVIEKHLQSFGYSVDLAVDGLDALEKLRTGRYSLVLTDLEMPRMTGFELVAEMRRQESLKQLPVIVVTSRDAQKHRRRAQELGANAYIIKPFSREQLGGQVEKLLGASAAVPA